MFSYNLLYTVCMFSMLLNGDIVDIEKPDGIFLLTFVVDEFSGLFFPSINLFYQKLNIIINDALSDFDND